MDVGFETIGNATLICHDREPILVTDPWITGDAYFGSWTRSHEIPEQQLASIRAAKFVWMSHGHPDHLCLQGLQMFSAAKVLLPDHVGGRIASWLKETQGYDVAVLKDRQWYQLSDRIRVMTLSDYNQDGILLVDINGRLVVDLNDATDRGWGSFVRSIVKQYSISFLMRLSGFGDADMINFFDEHGNSVVPRAARRVPVGPRIASMTRQFGTSHFVPFSSMHKYQRADSIWADAYTTDISDYAIDFDDNVATLLPAFIRYDCLTDAYEEISPRKTMIRVRDPKEFGDDWGDELEPKDVTELSAYFRSIEHLGNHFDFINFRVGGKETIIELANRRFKTGIIFEVPRSSLMTAVEHEIFDDLLIGKLHENNVARGWIPLSALLAVRRQVRGQRSGEDRDGSKALLSRVPETRTYRVPSRSVRATFP